MGIGVWLAAALLGASCTFASLQPEDARYRVALIDEFYPGDQVFATAQERKTARWLHGQIDLDRDWVREPYYHGDLVGMILAHPAVAIVPYAIRDSAKSKQEILRNLEHIKHQLGLGERLDAVLLPWESSTLISAFERPLQLDHAEAYKARLKDWGKTEASWRLSYDIIRALEALVEAGTQVYTIAGNGGPGMVNTYSFADGVVTVGAVEADLEKLVADNVFVDRHDRAAYLIRLMSDTSGRPIGYDVNNDQCADIPIACLSAYSPLRREYPATSFWAIRGSSFAAPTALRRQLTAQHPAAACAGGANGRQPQE